MNKLYIFLLPLFLISFASAIFSGETQIYPNDLKTTELVWIVTENTSMMDVMPIVNINESNITITIPSNMPPNYFNIVFLFKKDNEVATTIYVTNTVSSGGHSRTKIVNNTIIKEVPVIEYVNNETIKIVENKTTETEWKNIPTPTKWTWIFAIGFLILVIIICIILVKWSNSIEKETDERRLEENGERN
jgi:hypothetical protein